MSLYYFTFGEGQKIGDVLLEGKCQPIEAINMNAATERMMEMYNDKWCWVYTQEEWDDYSNSSKEEELEMIVVEG